MVTTMKPLRLLAPLISLAAACGLDAPQQYLVPDLRVVAIGASASGGPYADADITETVTLEALVLNPLGRTGVTLEWYGCLPALPGALAPCEDPDVLRDPQVLRDRASLGDTAGPFHIATGSPAPVTLDLSVAQEEILLAATDLLVVQATTTKRLQCVLYFELPIVAVVTEDSGEVTELALKYVRIAPAAAQAAFPGAYERNTNPVIAAREVNPAVPDDCTGGVPLTGTLPAAEATVCARATPDSPQDYKRCDEGGAPSVPNEVEDLDWQWYASAGEIAQAGFNGNVTANPIDFTPPAGAFTLWTIVRDGRGGTDWAPRP